MKPSLRPMRFAPLLAGALLSACTYGIVLDAGGQSVSTDWNGARARGCRDLGKVTVSVMSRVGPVDRNDITVRDELEIMARNQAAQMRADTVAPLGDPHDGEQSWEAYSCGTVAPGDDRANYPPPNSVAPVEDAPAADAPQADHPDANPDSGSNSNPDSDSDSAPSRDYPPAPQDQNAPQPFSAPAPAGSGAQTYPMSGSSG